MSIVLAIIFAPIIIVAALAVLPIVVAVAFVGWLVMALSAFIVGAPIYLYQIGQYEVLAWIFAAAIAVIFAVMIADTVKAIKGD